MSSMRARSASFSQPREPVLRRRRLPLGGIRRPALPGALLEPGGVVFDSANNEKLRSASGKIKANQRLLQRATMGWTEAEAIRLQNLGYAEWLEEQLDYEGLDDALLEQVLAQALPALSMSPAQILSRYENQRNQPIFQLILASLYRAVYSPRQLLERAVVFWSDHFSIDLLSGFQFLLKLTDDREVIRAHALGTFPDLLHASAKSPAMLAYLTNNSNVKDHPNENYARELMELHTLGVDGPYTEKDVKEVARCFTGWGFYGRQGGPELGRFFFNAAQHDTGQKRVLGQVIPAGGGIEDGERVLEILAGHPQTARFIAEKLTRYFWGYKPSKAIVNRVTDTYMRTDGDIRAMVRVLLKKNRMKRAKSKLKRPFHLMVSSLRALGAEIQNPRFVLEDLYASGHLPFSWPAPNGFPDSEDYWAGLVLPRWNFAAALPARKKSGIKFGGSYFDPELSARKQATLINDRLLNGGLSEVSQAAIEEFLETGPGNIKRVREAVALAVTSPEFQKY